MLTLINISLIRRMHRPPCPRPPHSNSQCQLAHSFQRIAKPAATAVLRASPCTQTYTWTHPVITRNYTTNPFGRRAMSQHGGGNHGGGNHDFPFPINLANPGKAPCVAFINIHSLKQHTHILSHTHTHTHTSACACARTYEHILVRD